MIHHVDAINICANGTDVHAGGVFAVVICKGGSKGYGVAGQHSGAVLGNLRIRVVVVYGGNGGIHRILVVIAVDKLDIIYIDATSGIAVGMRLESFGD